MRESAAWQHPEHEHIPSERRASAVPAGEAGPWVRTRLGDARWAGEDQPGPFKELPLAAQFCGLVLAANLVLPALALAGDMLPAGRRLSCLEQTAPTGAGLPRSSPAARETPREKPHLERESSYKPVSQSNHKKLKKKKKSPPKNKLKKQSCPAARCKYVHARL